MHAVTPKKLILEFGGFNINQRLSMTGKSPLMNIKNKPEIRKRGKRGKKGETDEQQHTSDLLLCLTARPYRTEQNEMEI